MSKVLALIPARGGSKGIPRKNVQDFGGIPLLGHKIRQASSAGVDEIWVSTDDSEISEIAKKFGATVIDRPAEYSLDTSSTDEVLNHAIQTLNPKESDILLLLQVTSPLISIESIVKCIQHLIQSPSLNCVISIHKSHPFLWSMDTDNVLNWSPKNHSRTYRPRRQELAPEGWETGGCYAIRVSALRNQGNRYPSPTGVVEVSLMEAIDIDTWSDLDAARKIHASTSQIIDVTTD
jgi:CMP-N-acetylneuraminic acid synthetase